MRRAARCRHDGIRIASALMSGWSLTRRRNELRGEIKTCGGCCVGEIQRSVVFGHRVHDLISEFVDQRESLASFVTHQADGRVVDDVPQQDKVLVLEDFFFGPDEVVPKVVFELGALLVDIREVDEKPRAHVPLEHLDSVRIRGFVPAYQQMAIL